MEFYNTNDKKFISPDFIIPAEIENQLEAILDHIEEKHNISIDIYGKNILYSNHLKSMLDFINNGEFGEINSSLLELSKYLASKITLNESVILLGD